MIIYSFLYALQVVCAVILMARDGSLKKVFSQWTLVGSLTASGLPAAIYALQNSLLQISYKNLDSLTFSILNQTKVFFTALFTYIILRYVHKFLFFLVHYSLLLNSIKHATMFLEVQAFDIL